MIQSIYKDKVFSDTRIDWVIYIFYARCVNSEIVFFSWGGAVFRLVGRNFLAFLRACAYAYACMRVRVCTGVRVCVRSFNPFALPSFTSSPHRTKRKETKNPLISFDKLKKSEKKFA